MGGLCEREMSRPFVFCLQLKCFEVWSIFMGTFFLCLVLDQKLRLMRIPTVELLESLPLAYYTTVEAALCFQF